MKQAGNAAFRDGRFQESVELYTSALACVPVPVPASHSPDDTVPVNNEFLYSNRSAAYTALGRYEEAIADGEACIAADPSWAKAYYRKALPLLKMGRLSEALEVGLAGLGKKYGPGYSDLMEFVCDLELTLAERRLALPPRPTEGSPSKESTEETSPSEQPQTPSCPETCAASLHLRIEAAKTAIGTVAKIDVLQQVQREAIADIISVTTHSLLHPTSDLLQQCLSILISITSVPENKIPIGSFKYIFNAVVRVLSCHDKLSVLVPALQLLANLTAYSQENVSRLLDAGIEEALKRIFSLSSLSDLVHTLFDPSSLTTASASVEQSSSPSMTPLLLRNCLDALAHIALDSPTMQESLSNSGISPFITSALMLPFESTLQPEHGLSIQATAAQVMNNLAHHSTGTETLDLYLAAFIQVARGIPTPTAAMDTVQSSKDASASPPTEIGSHNLAVYSQQTLIESLAALKTVVKKPGMLKKFLDTNALSTLASLALKSSTTPPIRFGEHAGPGEVGGEESAKHGCCGAVVNFLQCIARETSPEVKTTLWTPFLQHFVNCTEAGVGKEGQSLTRSTLIAHLLAAISLKEDAPAVLYPYMPTMIHWLDAGNADLQSSAAWILSSIASTDEYVMGMISRGVIHSVIGIIRHSFEEPNERLLLFVLSLLRNMTVPRAAKEPLVECGILPILVETLSKNRNQIILFTAVVTLSILVRENPRRIGMLVSCGGILPIMNIALCGNATGNPEETRPLESHNTDATDDQQPKEKDLRLQYEAARVIAMLCNYEEYAKLVWNCSSSTTTSTSTSSGQVPVEKVLGILAASKFDVLKEEAATATKALASHGLGPVSIQSTTQTPSSPSETTNSGATTQGHHAPTSGSGSL
ncbi:hypothetical protein Pelo_14428 [Pelomyxa schiedti]|nr:hypothetical protein Pelo_14428 [Pelomyxa schiedti]